MTRIDDGRRVWPGQGDGDRVDKTALAVHGRTGVKVEFRGGRLDFG